MIGSLEPRAKHVDKVLDVQQGEISYLVGTVYMDMKLKPNILNDITKDVSGRRDTRNLPAIQCGQIWLTHSVFSVFSVSMMS